MILHKNKNILYRSIAVLSISMICLIVIYFIKLSFIKSATNDVLSLKKTANLSTGEIRYPYNKDGQKVAYLTFDGGPSSNVTNSILQILKNYNIRATFFISGKNAVNNADVLLKAKKYGNTIGLISFNPDYKTLYKNCKNYLSDLKECKDITSAIVGNTGFSSYLLRYPGGSNMVNNNFKILIAKAGYKYIDWNVDSKDTCVKSSAELMTNIKESCKNKKHIVILMHDNSSMQETASTLPQIIEYLSNSGYIFKTL